MQTTQAQIPVHWRSHALPSPFTDAVIRYLPVQTIFCCPQTYSYEQSKSRDWLLTCQETTRITPIASTKTYCNDNCDCMKLTTWMKPVWRSRRCGLSRHRHPLHPNYSSLFWLNDVSMSRHTAKHKSCTVLPPSEWELLSSCLRHSMWSSWRHKAVAKVGCGDYNPRSAES